MADGGTFGMSIVLTFMTYCVEEYKAHKGLTGLQVEELFGRYGVFDTSKNTTMFYTRWAPSI